MHNKTIEFFNAVEHGNKDQVNAMLEQAKVSAIMAEVRLANCHHPEADITPIVLVCEQYKNASQDKQETYDTIAQRLLDGGAAMSVEFGRKTIPTKGYVSGSGQSIYMRYRGKLPPSIQSAINAVSYNYEITNHHHQD